MQKIDRLVWAEGTCLQSYGVKIGIRASKSGALERLVPLLPPQWEPIEPPRRLDTLYSWVVGGERRPNVRAFDIMYEGAGRIARTLKPEELFEAFETGLRLTLALLSRRFVFIHAGVVGWRGRAILIPGRTFTGKSTLVEALVRAGAEYLSDEYALLDRNGRVHPFAKPISLRMPETFEQRPRSLVELGGRTADGPIKVGAILQTRFQEGAKSRFREASSGQGVLALIANAVAARFAPSRVVSRASSAGADALVLRGPRGEAQEAAQRLLTTFDERWAVRRRTVAFGSLGGIARNSQPAADG